MGVNKTNQQFGVDVQGDNSTFWFARAHYGAGGIDEEVAFPVADSSTITGLIDSGNQTGFYSYMNANWTHWSSLPSAAQLRFWKAAQKVRA